MLKNTQYRLLLNNTTEYIQNPRPNSFVAIKVSRYTITTQRHLFNKSDFTSVDNYAGADYDAVLQKIFSTIELKETDPVFLHHNLATDGHIIVLANTQDFPGFTWDGKAIAKERIFDILSAYIRIIVTQKVTNRFCIVYRKMVDGKMVQRRVIIEFVDSKLLDYLV